MKTNDLSLSLAILYENLGPNDDRLRVRPIPELLDVPDEELDYLPAYPMFFKEQVITGFSEKDHGKDAADVVWICHSKDFDQGWIMGKANNYGANTSQKYPNSYNYSEVRKYLQGRHALPDDFDYDHIVIRLKSGNDDSSVDSNTGGVIELYNFLTGDYVILNTSGSVLCVMQHQIYIRVGTPSSSGGGGSSFSAITVKGSEINLKSPLIFLDGKSVVLGAHGLSVVGTPGSSPVWAEGVPLIPMKNITG
jgi:hypothetical protein